MGGSEIVGLYRDPIGSDRFHVGRIRQVSDLGTTGISVGRNRWGSDNPGIPGCFSG